MSAYSEVIPLTNMIKVCIDSSAVFKVPYCGNKNRITLNNKFVNIIVRQNKQIVNLDTANSNKGDLEVLGFGDFRDILDKSPFTGSENKFVRVCFNNQEKSNV